MNESISNPVSFGARISSAIERRAKETGSLFVPLTNRHEAVNVLGWVNPDGTFGGLNFRTVGQFTAQQNGEMHGSLVFDEGSRYGVTGRVDRDKSLSNSKIAIEIPEQGVIFPQSLYPREGSLTLTEGRLNQITLIAERGRIEPAVSGVPIELFSASSY